MTHSALVKLDYFFASIGGYRAGSVAPTIFYWLPDFTTQQIWDGLYSIKKAPIPQNVFGDRVLLIGGEKNSLGNYSPEIYEWRNLLTQRGTLMETGSHPRPKYIAAVHFFNGICYCLSHDGSYISIIGIDLNSPIRRLSLT